MSFNIALPIFGNAFLFVKKIKMRLLHKICNSFVDRVNMATLTSELVEAELLFLLLDAFPNCHECFVNGYDVISVTL